MEIIFCCPMKQDVLVVVVFKSQKRWLFVPKYCLSKTFLFVESNQLAIVSWYGSEIYGSFFIPQKLLNTNNHFLNNSFWYSSIYIYIYLPRKASLYFINNINKSSGIPFKLDCWNTFDQILYSWIKLQYLQGHWCTAV